MQPQINVVYLLHFDAPLGNLDNPRGQAQHYLGWTPYLPARITAHLAGRGARLTQVARERGIGFVIARVWPGDRTFERRLKRRKEGPKLCPICRQAARTRHQLALDLEDDLL
jgi:predicted GIY-YIG superfamily endonuclease